MCPTNSIPHADPQAPGMLCSSRTRWVHRSVDTDCTPLSIRSTGNTQQPDTTEQEWEHHVHNKFHNSQCIYIHITVIMMQKKNKEGFMLTNEQHMDVHTCAWCNILLSSKGAKISAPFPFFPFCTLILEIINQSVWQSQLRECS